MSDELIRKSEVLELIDSLNISDRQNYEDLIFNIEDMTPVNAVELPCKAGTVIYVLQRSVKLINETKVLDFRVAGDDVYLHICGYGYYSSYYIGKVLFFSREEAEKALEDLKLEDLKNE